MTHIVYVGQHDAVEIADTGQVVEHGVSVEVDTDLADQLLTSSVWQRPTTNAAKAVKEESA